MTRPTLYIVTGLPYAGKSVLSRELVRRFGFRYASVDDELTDGSYDVTRMTQDDWNAVYGAAYEKLEGLLRGGNTVVFDGASLKRSERQTLRAIAEKWGAEPMLVYVNTPVEEILERRLRNRTTRERAHLEDKTMDRALGMFEEPTADEQPAIYNAGFALDAWLERNIVIPGA